MQLNTIARGGAYMLIGRLLTVVLQFGYNIGLARLFGAETTGLFAFGFSLVNLVSIFGLLGAQETLLRFVAVYSGKKDDSLLRGVLFFGFGIGIVGSLIATWLLWENAKPLADFADKPEVAPLLYRFAPAVLLLALISLISAALQGAKKLDKVVLIREIGLALAVSVALILVWLLDFNFYQFISLYTFSLIILIAFGARILWSTFYEAIKLKSISKTYQVWGRFSMLVAATSLLQKSSGRIEIIILTYYLSNKDVGIYFVAFRTGLLINAVLYATNAILAPVAAELWHQNNVSGLERAYKTTTRWTFLLTLPIATSMIVLRRELMAMFGSEFEIGTTILLILLFGRLANSITGGVGRLLVMSGNQQWELLNTIINIILMLGGLFWVVPRYGILGAAVINSIVVMGMNTLKIIQVKKLLGIQPYELAYLKPLIAGIISCVIGFVIYTQIQMLPMILLLAAITLIITGSYLMLLFQFGLPKEDQIILREARNKFFAYF